MAESAGIVNDRGKSNSEAFVGLIETRSDEVKELALATRDLIYDVYPATVEVVWPRQGTVGWGVGPKKFSEQFAYFMAYGKHVTLGFYRGGDLADPVGLLPKSGGRQAGGELSMRSLKIDDVAQTRLPALRALIESAVSERQDR
jgi:hypothetical protein